MSRAHELVLKTHETRRLATLTDKELVVEWVGGRGKTRRGNPAYKIKVVARYSLGAVLMVAGYVKEVDPPCVPTDHRVDRPEYPELWFWDFESKESKLVFAAAWDKKVTPSVKRWAANQFLGGQAQ